LAIYQEFEFTIKRDKGLVFICVAVRWRTSPGLNMLNQRRGKAAGGCGIDENVNAISEDAKGLN
jgi:hypothetical protein